MELNGSKDYNISINVSKTQKFMCLNRSRNNRVSNAIGSVLTGEQLADNDFVVPENGKQELGWPWGSGDNKIWGPKGIQLGFKFYGEDPYNITIMTSYTGREVHVTDNISGDPVKAATTRPFEGATLFGKMGNDQMWFDASNDRHYKIKSGMTNSDVDLKTGEYKNYAKYVEKRDAYNKAAVAEQYDTWVGYYRKEYFAEVNTYALLPNGDDGYMFVASKMNMGNSGSKTPTINQPDGNKYFVYTDNGATNKPTFTKKALSSAYPTNIYEIRTYTVYVKTHGSEITLSATMRWSDARLSDNPAEHFPDVLKRKYCSYTAFSDADCTKPANTFQAIQDADNGLKIYLKYTVSESMPFKTLDEGESYTNAQWYTMRMDGVANPKYVAYNDGSSNVVVTNESGAAKGSNTASQIHQGENSAAAMVAFMGDPYELKILNRKACETATAGNKFIGCSYSSPLNTTLTTNNTGPSDIITWEIVYESTGVDGILLRKFKTANEKEGSEETPTPKYIGLGDATNYKPVTYSATSSRIRVVELEKKKYAFHIMRIDGTIAVMATTMEDVGKPLKGDYTDIPEIIRSSYLSSAIVNFYATQADAEADNDPSKKISNLPYNPDGLKEGVYANIYVRYSYASGAPANATYNVRVNNDYIYTNGTAIESKTSITDSEREEGAYQWIFNFGEESEDPVILNKHDPYALTIKNAAKAEYMYISSLGDGATISWDATGSKFIVKSGNTPGTYEVMAATGDETDASETYYNIGRPADNTVMLYRNSSYLSGNATLRFQFSAITATDVTYHLVDMSGNELLVAHTRQDITKDHPAFPPEYYSPLVSAYYYHTTLAHAKANRITGDIADNAAVNHADVYVTYEVNDLVDLKAGQLYLLKYEAGELFRQENGSDGLLDPMNEFEGTENAKKNRYQAVYPYCNGDGNFFVYGQEQYELQQEGASSTRIRWAWFVESNVEGAPKGDPYHVTIKSRQTESYPFTNSSEYNAYFMTYKPDGYSQVITTLGWPGMNSETATEYMVLGSEGQYQLVTTNEIGGSRYVVDSFEQYWKTYDTIRRKLLKQLSKDDYPDADDDKILVQSTPCLVEGFTDNRTYLTTSTTEATPGLGWHSYEKWAYAKRWNGYNNGYNSEDGTHKTSKGWEKIEHWYQTVKMGEGYFDFVKTSIDPVLILLDQHGWEIMRRPLPAGPDDPKKEVKYAAIRPYNSPMVKEYAFWATAKKRSGFHQYYQLKDRVGGKNFTSTDLTNLPPYGSANVLDKKGNQNDQYVTYIVKDEYAQTYNPANKSAKPFLIEQGTDHKYATTNEGGTELNATAIPNDGDMKAYILNGGTIADTEKWYVKPNVNIDDEMGYSDPSISHDWKENKSGYELDSYKNERTAQYIDDDDNTLGQFSFSNGFDPYNIQIQSVGVTTGNKFMKTNANGAELHEGSIVGSYPTNPVTIGMGANTGTISPNPKWYDSRNLYVTNATFMAVQDAAGNMQLMPRFDHSTRMSEFGTLIAPTDAQVATTYTKLYRPEKYEYLIIDNDGHESLRYKTGGDMTPQTPDHFQSPLAKNFTYYATASYDSGTEKYSGITDEIEGSLDGATLTDNKVYVRYEYDEEADDFLKILKGNWLTMQLNNLKVYYKTDGLYGTNSYSLTATSGDDLTNQAKKLKETGDYYFKVATDYYKVEVTSAYVDEVYAIYTTDVANESEWSVASEGFKKEAKDNDDMYAKAQKLETNGVYYFKIGSDEYVKVTVTSPYTSATDARYVSPVPGEYSDKWDASIPLVIDADAKKWQWKFLETPQSEPDPYALYIYNRSQTAGTKAVADRFALLSHSEGDYALARAGENTTYNYSFLNGSGMNESTAAYIAVESGFTPTAGTYLGTGSQVKLTDEVQHTFIYKVYTNGGVNAIDASQTQEDVNNNDWKPVLPGAARTPLLNIDQYRYYEQDLSFATPDTIGNSLSHLFGLYDDIVYTHYTPYNPDVSNYLVPNVRNDKDVDPVAPGLGSNDAPIGLDGKRPYNIIWEPDNMMKSNDAGTSIALDADQDLRYTAAYEWEFEGDDPYAIKIKSVGASTSGDKKYIHEATTTTTELSTTPTTFMLLNRDDYDYGVFTVTGSAVTGGTPVMLSGYGNTLTTGDPTKFIPFALSTYKVIYHLMIKNIGEDIIIPYRENKTVLYNPANPDEILTKIKKGTTLRDLEMKVEGDGHTDGDYYQLGSSLKALQLEASGLFNRDSIYCVDAGHVSLGDAFEVPQQFYRPNVKYDFYIEGVYSEDGKSEITAMNSEYKGLKMTNLGEDTGLLGNIVFVNIVYNFMGGLDTNSGSDFVESVAQNKWFTFETNDATPMLAEYSSSLQTKSGYATHYTNDYLWTPVGDPYGFKMYNRYIHKNIGGTAQVMSTTERTSGTNIEMVNDNTTKPHLPTNSVYELLSTSTTTPGYFRIHPVANMKDDTQVYMRNNSSTGTGSMTLYTVPTDWTFGLSEDVMRPYFLAAGYVGGLNETGKAAYDVEDAKTNPLERLMGLQDVVYNHDNNPENENYIVHYKDGYYRMHSQPGSSDITTPRYMSGYTHKTELTPGTGTELAPEAIPLHFYEVEEYSMKNPTFRDLESGQTVTNATQGDIPLVTVTNDPASIFRFTEGEGGITLSTQGLYVKENKMTATEGEATKFDIVDIGAGIVALQQHGGTNFLKYAQNIKKDDLKYDSEAATVESARWCMKPVQKDATAKDGEMPLTVKTNNGGDGYYYTTFYAPFDVLMTSGNDEAYIVPEGEWPAMTAGKKYVMQPKKIGEVNTGGYTGNNQFIPVGTPVIIRTKNTGGIVTMVLPNATPSSVITTALSGTYLEQMLAQGSDYVFVFGRSYTNNFGYNPETGVVTPAGLEVDRGVGFYKNANINRESNETKTLWERNNKYVYANKVYYRAGVSAGAPAVTRGVEFIPVIFDDDENEGELQPDGSQQQMVGDGCIYDLMGRKVATEQQVQDGSWNTILSPGIYIINGKKFSKK